jgi:hypothetical protein
MNVVNFQTAKALKEAGFPQPKLFNAFQWSYIDGDIQVPYRATAREKRSEDEILAPNATEILKELGYDYSMKYHNGMNKWMAWVEYDNDGWDSWDHENPAEAAALAFLAKKKKV